MGYNDIMSLWFYDFQNILMSYKNIIEQRNKEEQDQAKKQGFDKNNLNPNNMMKSMQSSIPKMPSFSGFKM